LEGLSAAGTGFHNDKTFGRIHGCGVFTLVSKIVCFWSFFTCVRGIVGYFCIELKMKKS
jgi:hypothetical protein